MLDLKDESKSIMTTQEPCDVLLLLLRQVVNIRWLSNHVPGAGGRFSKLAAQQVVVLILTKVMPKGNLLTALDLGFKYFPTFPWTFGCGGDYQR